MVWQPYIDNVVTHVVQSKDYEAIGVVGGTSMSFVKRALSTAGMLGLGVLAAIGIYLACVVATFLAGGWVYSIALGAQVAPVIGTAIVIYRWTRRRITTSWPMMAAMVVTQVVMATLAFQDSRLTVLMLLH